MSCNARLTQRRHNIFHGVLFLPTLLSLCLILLCDYFLLNIVNRKTLPRAQHPWGLSLACQSILMCHITSSNTNLDQTSFSESQPIKGMIVLVFSPILEEMLENAAVFVWRLPFDPAPFLPFLHSIAWYCIVLHGIALYCMVLHGIALYCMVLHGIA